MIVHIFKHTSRIDANIFGRRDLPRSDRCCGNIESSSRKGKKKTSRGYKQPSGPFWGCFAHLVLRLILEFGRFGGVDDLKADIYVARMPSGAGCSVTLGYLSQCDDAGGYTKTKKGGEMWCAGKDQAYEDARFTGWNHSACQIGNRTRKVHRVRHVHRSNRQF